jgi:hypothetical protein
MCDGDSSCKSFEIAGCSESTECTGPCYTSTDSHIGVSTTAIRNPYNATSNADASKYYRTYKKHKSTECPSGHRQVAGDKNEKCCTKTPNRNDVSKPWLPTDCPVIQGAGNGQATCPTVDGENCLPF